MEKYELKLRFEAIRNLLNELELHIRYEHLEGVDVMLKEISKEATLFRKCIKEEMEEIM